MSTTNTNHQHAAPAAPPVGPPTKHQLALMIWVAVFPTLVVLNLTLGPLLEDLNVAVRTFVLATVAVPTNQPCCFPLRRLIRDFSKAGSRIPVSSSIRLSHLAPRLPSMRVNGFGASAPMKNLLRSCRGDLQ